MQRKFYSLFILCLNPLNFSLEQYKKRTGQEEEICGTICVAGIEKLWMGNVLPI